MSEIKDGYYDGELKGVEFSTDQWDDKAVMVEFQVEVEGQAVTCRHSTGTWDGGRPQDEKAQRFSGVLETFGLEGIGDLPKLAQQKGSVRVRAKTSDKGRLNFYISTPRKSESLTPEEVAKKIEGWNDEVPF